MAQAESLISEEMRAQIGVESAPRSFVVEAGNIAHFARAIDDPNPIYTDEAYARKTPYGGIIAPPTFFRAAGYALQGPGPRREAPQGGGGGGGAPAGGTGLDGGSEWEFHEPVRPGDVITVVSKLVDLQQREGRAGAMIIRRTETSYTNQHGQLVAKQFGTGVTQYRREQSS
jgi:acyl dehydratase